MVPVVIFFKEYINVLTSTFLEDLFWITVILFILHHDVLITQHFYASFLNVLNCSNIIRILVLIIQIRCNLYIM